MSNASRTPPPFAAEWAAQWRAAGPLLQAIRDQELRELSNERAIEAAELAFVPPEQPHATNSAYSGLIVQQAWFMRLRLLNAMRRSP